MIRCVRLWSGPDGHSHFEEGVIDLKLDPRGDALSRKFLIASVSFQETNADPKLGWHPDSARQLVVTLNGTLEFTTHHGRFLLRSGDIVFTEDTVAGHGRTLLGEQPCGGASMPSLSKLPSFRFGRSTRALPLQMLPR